MSSCNDPCADNISIIVDTASAGPIGPPGPPSAVVEWTFYPSVGDTIVSGDDASAKPLAYQEDSVQVFLNGVMLSKRDDYTTDDDGLSIVLNESIVNAGDIVNVLSQMPPSDFDPTNDHNRLQGQIDENKNSIEGLDVRVTANEEAIEGLEGLAGGFTTRDVKVSGVNTSRAIDDDVTLETQQHVNLYLDSSIGTVQERLDAIEGGQPDLSSDIEDLRTDVDENTQGIADNAEALNGLVDIVESNATDIDGLKNEIDKLPPPTDISDLEKDVDDIAKSVGSNTIAIAKNTADIAALPEMTIDLDPLNDAISLNAMGISSNAADITKLQATDAKHTGQLSDLETAVGHLEAIEMPDNYAVVDEDNSFETSQTIKSGINITGAEAFVKADTGTAVTFSNNNAFNPVIEIERSNGDVSLALHADGHIRGVKTDENDDTSAVSVGYFEANVGAGGGDSDLSKYATKIELADEELARKLADEQLQKNIDALEAFDETKLTNRIAQEEAARAAGDASLDGKIKTEAKYREDNDDALQAQIDALQIPAVDPSLYATLVAMHAGDAETLAAANKYTNEAIADIDFPEGVDLDGYATKAWTTEQIEAIEFPAGTVVGDTAPVDPALEEGATWYDTVRLELFVFAEGAWLPCSPLGARVEAGEATQAALISQVDDALEKQLALTKTVNDRSRTQDGLVVTTQLLSDKVDALEGSTLDAKYKADARDNPQIGSFVLQDADGNKVLKFADAKKIELSKTDFTNKAVGLSKVMNGDIIRLVLSPTHYANYTIASVDPKEQTFVFGLTFGSAGAEEVVFDGAVYNFTHATPFDPEAFATIDYVDAQDVKRISLSGENTIDTSWRVKSGNKTIMSGAEEGKIKIYHLAEPTDGDHAATKTYADKMLPRSGTSDLIGDWRVRQENEENNYSTLIHGDNGQLGLYNLKDPGDSHHAVPRSYVDDANVANAKKTDSNTFKEVNTFQKTTYFQNGIVHANGNNDTLTEVRGENEETKEFWHKLRGTCKASWIAYPGQENSGYKRCMTMEWDQESGKPQVFIDYVMDPVNGKHCANKQYVDQKVAEAGGGSFANTGPTTPDLSAGELFFNTTDKVLYIGE